MYFRYFERAEARQRGWRTSGSTRICFNDYDREIALVAECDQRDHRRCSTDQRPQH